MRNARLLPLSVAFLLSCGAPKSTGPAMMVTPTAPVLTATPAMGATNVPVTADMIVTSNEALDPASVTANTATLTDSNNNEITLTPSLSSNGLTVTLVPMGGMMENTSYTLYVVSLKATAALGGLAQAAPLTVSFTTGAANPTVVDTTPGAGSNGVPLTTQITLTFSVPVQDSTPSAIKLLDTTAGANPAQPPVTVTVSGAVATVVPMNNLFENHAYSVVVGAGLTSVTGNLPLAGAPVTVLMFTTAENPPTVVSATPANQATGVLGNVQPTITFSTAMDPATVTHTTITLVDTATSMTLGTTVTLDSTKKIATIVPTEPLGSNVTYSLTATTGVKDSSDIPLTASFNTTFTTALFPSVIQFTPADMATGVSVTTEIQVYFNEALGPVSATTFTLTAMGSSTPLGGSISTTPVSASMVTMATFLPNPQLLPSTTYTATLSGLSDMSGKPLPTYTSTFSTPVYPIVVSSSPTVAPPETGVLTTTTISVTFSTPVTPLNATSMTVETDPFVLHADAGPGVPVTGTVTTAGGTTTDTTVTFTPSQALQMNMQYKVTFTGVKDTMGNALEDSTTPWSFTFTTGAT